MGWFTSEVSSTVDAAGNLVQKTGQALDSLFTSDDERNAAEILKRKIEQNPQQWAHQLNLINAKSSSWFNSGWRPGLGWVCVLAAFCYYIPQFLLASYLWVVASLALPAGAALPAYPITDAGLWQLVAVLFGNGALRTVEKLKGVARS